MNQRLSLALPLVLIAAHAGCLLTYDTYSIPKTERRVVGTQSVGVSVDSHRIDRDQLVLSLSSIQEREVKIVEKTERTVDFDVSDLSLGMGWIQMHDDLDLEILLVINGVYLPPLFAIDIVTLGTSSIYSSVVGAFSSIDTSSSSRTTTEARAPVTGRVSVKGKHSDMEFNSVAADRGVARVELGNAAYKLLGQGQTTEELRIETAEGLTATYALHLDDLAQLAAEYVRENESATETVLAAIASAGEVPAHWRAVAKALDRLGVQIGKTDEEALDLFRQGRATKIQLVDRTVVDWSTGSLSLAPMAQATLLLRSDGVAVTAGERARALLRVSNVGKGDLYQLFGTTVSDLPEADGIPVLFGRIAPGESVERQISIPTPRTFPGGSVSLRVRFDEANGFAPDQQAAKFAIASIDSPRLALSLEVVDDGSGQSVGNGDGVVPARRIRRFSAVCTESRWCGSRASRSEIRDPVAIGSRGLR